MQLAIIENIIIMKHITQKMCVHVCMYVYGHYIISNMNTLYNLYLLCSVCVVCVHNSLIMICYANDTLPVLGLNGLLFGIHNINKIIRENDRIRDFNLQYTKCSHLLEETNDS
jgi:hypothetical protein